MYADRSATDDHVAGLRPVGGNADTFGYDADTACIDEEFVAFAPFHHLRVAGDDLHAGTFGCRLHRQDDAPEVGKRQSLFQDKAGSQVKRTGAAAS